MSEFDKYIRVGIKYFKISKYTDGYGVVRNKLIGWGKEALVDDYGKEVLRMIRKYDDFVLEPNNVNYQQIINNKWNIYSEFPFKQAVGSEYIEPVLTLKFLKHIFGDKYDIGLRYMQSLYQHPKQGLPILALVSTERMTGKSTFIDYLNVLFGDNATILEPSRMSSSFNSSYASKLVIAVEETEFQSKAVSEKLKALSTLNKISVNTKMVQEYEVPFYGKIILASNNEDKFSIVREDEIRYLVVKIPHIDVIDIDILVNLKKEAPSFLKFIANMEPLKIRTRMVFTAEELDNKALKKVKEESKSALAKDLSILLKELSSKLVLQEVIYFTASDIKRTWFNNSRYNIHYISKVLKEELGIERSKARISYNNIDQAEGQAYRSVGEPFMLKNEYYEDKKEKEKHNNEGRNNAKYEHLLKAWDKNIT